MLLVLLRKTRPLSDIDSHVCLFVFLISYATTFADPRHCKNRWIFCASFSTRKVHANALVSSCRATFGPFLVPWAIDFQVWFAVANCRVESESRRHVTWICSWACRLYADGHVALAGPEFDTGLKGDDDMAVHATVRDLLEEVYRKAGELQLWSIVRYVLKGGLVMML